MKSGQVMTEEIKERMRESKRKQILSKYNWMIVDSYLDVVVENGASKRSKKHITLREFKERL